MLWDTGIEAPRAHAVADNDFMDEVEGGMRIISNNWTGPYTGPTRIRRFLVVREGIRSSYCL